jgi:predicted RNase H-like nuclease
MKFIGMDLGWRSGETGLCCLSLQGDGLRVLELTRRQSLENIFTWLDRWLLPEEGGLVAVDAPTVITNLTGARPCDGLTHRYFGRYHAGCYPANLGRPFAERTVTVGRELEGRGFIHAPEIIPQKIGRYQIEVFPHPAMIHLFGLSQILKYKKGKLGERKLELARLQGYLLSVLPRLTPALELTANVTDSLRADLAPLKSKDLKALEDQLDSLVCAYVGAYWWRWGAEKNWVLGDRASGYIIVPAPLPPQTLDNSPPQSPLAPLEGKGYSNTAPDGSGDKADNYPTPPGAPAGVA